MSRAVRVSQWEMGITRAEFVRLLSGVEGFRREALEDGRGAGGDGSLGWRVRWVERPPRRIGGLGVPVLDVELRVEAPDDAEAQRFVKRFLLAFQRAGG